MRVSEVWVRFDDGAQTVLEQWGEHGPAMLLVHGMTSSRKGWQRLANAFSSKYRVYAYDQRGHGDAAEYAADMRLERCVRDLEEIARAIDMPITVAIGHSWGGAVAIAGGRRVDARTVIAIDPMLVQAPQAWYGEYVEELAETFALHGDARDERVRSEYAGHPLDADGKVHAMHAMSVDPIAHLSRDNPLETWPVIDMLCAFDRPLLLAMADPSESIVDEASMQRVRACMPACVQIETFAGEGHSLHRSAFEHFVSSAERFLDAAQVSSE